MKSIKNIFRATSLIRMASLIRAASLILAFSMLFWGIAGCDGGGKNTGGAGTVKSGEKTDDDSGQAGDSGGGTSAKSRIAAQADGEQPHTPISAEGGGQGGQDGQDGQGENAGDSGQSAATTAVAQTEAETAPTTTTEAAATAVEAATTAAATTKAATTKAAATTRATTARAAATTAAATTRAAPTTAAATTRAAGPSFSEFGVKSAINLDFRPDFGKNGSAYAPVKITPKVADYKINPDLSNVVNLGQFPNLTAGQRQKLASNGFVVAPGSNEQLFYIYEDNTYKKIPNFITTDSVMQVYHIFYDFALRSAEANFLFSNALVLNQNMLAQLQKEYAAITVPVVRAEALKALAYFGVAQILFGERLPQGFPAEAAMLVERELALIEEAAADFSPIFGFKIDYSLFTPRGHYTRSEALTKYFMGLSWYGVVPLPLLEADGKTGVEQTAMASIIIVSALCGLDGRDGADLWENIYSPTSFFVGAADDITPFQLAGVISNVYGGNPNLDGIADPEKLSQFFSEVKKLPKPQIVAKTAVSEAGGGHIPTGVQFRFMGQRYIADSEILQELSESLLRPIPTGLDVFASLGSKRAADIIATIYRPAEAWPDYTKNFQRMKEKFTGLPDSVWQSNMYFAWLWTQNSLTGEYGKGYPTFMRNTAWQDKALATALGAWAEMRHDTILYAKGSAAECGGDNVPPVVRAYVEPNPELYNRLLWLASFSRINLSARGILPEHIEYVFEYFERLLGFLLDCSIKELNGEDLSVSEYDTLLTYGGTLENLTTQCIEGGYNWYQIESEADKDMAVIADVHTIYTGGFLEEAVGHAAEIYVVAPMGGELYLTRGAVFDYFEFVADVRMTDEQWQELIKHGPPERPPFVASFHEGEAPDVPAPLEPYSTGC